MKTLTAGKRRSSSAQPGLPLIRQISPLRIFGGFRFFCCVPFPLPPGQPVWPVPHVRFARLYTTLSSISERLIPYPTFPRHTVFFVLNAKPKLLLQDSHTTRSTLALMLQVKQWPPAVGKWREREYDRLKDHVIQCPLLLGPLKPSWNDRDYPLCPYCDLTQELEMTPPLAARERIRQSNIFESLSGKRL